MNNQYIFYPSIPFDVEQIRDIVSRRLHETLPGYPTHHRKVADEPYLVELQKLYPFFIDIYSIYNTTPRRAVPIHTDSGRKCAVNIPISYTEDSHTIFYKIKEDIEITRIPERVYDVIKEEDVIEEVFRFTLDRPTLLNTRVPHNAIGGPLRNRIIMSWSVSLDYDYDTTKTLLGG
jgi:hypothetical protein